MVPKSGVQGTWKYETYEAIVRVKLGRCIFQRLQPRINADVESFSFRFVEQPRNKEDIESFRFIAPPTQAHTRHKKISSFFSCWTRSRRNHNVRHVPVGAQDFTCLHPHVSPAVPILILGGTDLTSQTCKTSTCVSPFGHALLNEPPAPINVLGATFNFN